MRHPGLRHGALAGLRRRSPVHGLDRRNLGPLEVLAQSMSSAAPAAGMASVPAIVAASAGSGTVWSVAIATGLALVVAYCIAQFTRRMAAAGSLYSLTAQGMGAGGGLASAAAVLVGYGVLVMAAITGAAQYLDAVLVRVGVAPGGDPVLLAVLALAVAGVAAALVLLGVRLSARIVLVVEACSITLMTVVFATLLLGDGVPGSRMPEAGLGGVLIGVLPALGAFIGFESATTLGVEARRPYRSVPRAVLGTAVVVGALCLFAAIAQVSGGVPVADGAPAPEPVVLVATAGRPQWLAIALDLGIVTSFFACTVASSNALVRVLFSLGRDGVASRRLGATHRRYRTPHVAIAVALPVAAVVPAGALLAGVPAARTLGQLLTISAAGFLVAYLLICLAAPLFLRRIGELTPGPVVAATVIVPILALVCAVAVVSAQDGPVPLALAGSVVAALGWYAWLHRRHPTRLRGIGVYDETSVADVLDVVGRSRR